MHKETWSMFNQHTHSHKQMQCNSNETLGLVLRKIPPSVLGINLLFYQCNTQIVIANGENLTHSTLGEEKSRSFRSSGDFRASCKLNGNITKRQLKGFRAKVQILWLISSQHEWNHLSGEFMINYSITGRFTCLLNEGFFKGRNKKVSFFQNDKKVLCWQHMCLKCSSQKWVN